MITYCILTFFFFTCSDNIAKGLVNALLNSGDKPQIKKGKEFLKKLNQQQQRKKK